MAEDIAALQREIEKYAGSDNPAHVATREALQKRLNAAMAAQGDQGGSGGGVSDAQARAAEELRRQREAQERFNQQGGQAQPAATPAPAATPEPTPDNMPSRAVEAAMGSTGGARTPAGESAMRMAGQEAKGAAPQAQAQPSGRDALLARGKAIYAQIQELQKVAQGDGLAADKAKMDMSKLAQEYNQIRAQLKGGQ